MYNTKQLYDYAAIGRKMMARAQIMATAAQIEAAAYKIADEIGLGGVFRQPPRYERGRQITLMWAGDDSSRNRPADECATLGCAIEEHLAASRSLHVVDWTSDYVYIILNCAPPSCSDTPKIPYYR